MQSETQTLNKTDFKKIAINGGIVMLGALLSFLAQTLPTLDFGHYQVFGTVLIFLVGYTLKRFFAGK